ncbi:MAG: thioredoxin family protein [Ktedonobacteraceae bacterium]
MPELLIRIGILICVSLLIWAGVWIGRRYVEGQRRRVLTATPLNTLSENGTPVLEASSPGAEVRILAFSSEDCSQCHTLQAPALMRVKESFGDKVAVIEVDAPHQPELTERYRVLTVPTTVVLDAVGQARAVNYGFANTQQLRKQVNEVLGESIT